MFGSPKQLTSYPSALYEWLFSDVDRGAFRHCIEDGDLLVCLGLRTLPSFVSPVLLLAIPVFS